MIDISSYVCFLRPGLWSWQSFHLRHIKYILFVAVLTIHGHLSYLAWNAQNPISKRVPFGCCFAFGRNISTDRLTEWLTDTQNKHNRFGFNIYRPQQVSNSSSWSAKDVPPRLKPFTSLAYNMSIQRLNLVSEQHNYLNMISDHLR